MLPYTIIEKKATGSELSTEEIQFFVGGYTRGDIPDYQMSALLMAIFQQGMTPTETLALTRVMLDSGEKMDFSDLAGFVADKHSTGGVGDKTSLIIAPVLAVLGVHVPMISGRGLGHTGGTLDKLESIPGFNVNQDLPAFRKIVADLGCSLIGQTATIAPADKKLYALRDVTATVRSIPLITASIMSKKIAEGIRGLVLDVKTGNGAFMQGLDEARQLAQNLVEVGERYGIRTTALITDMNQPLGQTIGNWLEVEECLEVLHGRGPMDLRDLSLALGAEILQMADPQLSHARALELQQEVMADGQAYERFLAITAAHGGDPSVLEDPSGRGNAHYEVELHAERSGFVTHIATTRIGFAGITLRAGRRVMTDDIDALAGVRLTAKLGTEVGAGDPLCTLYAEDKSVLEDAAAQIASCFEIGDQPPLGRSLVYETISRYHFFGQTSP